MLHRSIAALDLVRPLFLLIWLLSLIREVNEGAYSYTECRRPRGLECGRTFERLPRIKVLFSKIDSHLNSAINGSFHL